LDNRTAAPSAPAGMNFHASVEVVTTQSGYPRGPLAARAALLASSRWRASPRSREETLTATEGRECSGSNTPG
jgi:hypothetical protein